MNNDNKIYRIFIVSLNILFPLKFFRYILTLVSVNVSQNKLRNWKKSFLPLITYLKPNALQTKLMYVHQYNSDFKAETFLVWFS